MKDLTVRYIDENSEVNMKEYDTIMDFLDEVSSENPDMKLINGQNISAVFFENPLNTKLFPCFFELYRHCKEITK